MVLCVHAEYSFITLQRRTVNTLCVCLCAVSQPGSVTDDIVCT